MHRPITITVEGRNFRVFISDKGTFSVYEIIERHTPRGVFTEAEFPLVFAEISDIPILSKLFQKLEEMISNESNFN